uniref:Nucleolar protein 14 n=1 Tax=Parascaris univalens TaxID=6257 RepID=A0A915AKP5_PARUN
MARISGNRANKGTKRGAVVKKVNPFELKFNRNKHKILGKGTTNIAVGAPTLSKKKAYDNRIRSLAIELKQIGKSNKVIDRRLGEHDIRMTQEDRLIQRFTAERLKAFKMNKFQLAEAEDDEELTHKGSALTSVQKYERTISDEEDEDGEVDANTVSTTHFGGGTVGDGDDRNSQRHTKRKDLIAALIAKTKQQRYDKQMARDEQEDTTERLDEQWKKLMHTGAMTSFANVPRTNDRISKTSDEYDLLLCELKMDSGKRGEASERQKTADEIARDERLKLIELERARLARMEDNSPEKSLLADGSVEDISSGVAKSKKRSGFEVKYDEEGRLIQSEKVKRARIKLVRIDNESDSENDESISDDMKSDEEDFDSMLQREDQLDNMESEDRIAFADSVHTSTDETKETSLPYVFEMPSSYEKLAKLLQNHSATEVLTIVERLMKCYHPSLQEGNKKRLSRLFLYLLRFYDDLSMNDGVAKIEILGVLIKCLYSLLKFDVEYGMRCVRALLRQQWRSYRRDRHSPFGFRPLSIVRLVAALFPVTDFFHPICTPTIAFAVNMVANVRVACIRTAARILLLVVLITEYITETKRFIPEVMAFMRGLFLMGVENTDEERSPTASFPISLPYRRMLFIENDVSL